MMRTAILFSIILFCNVGCASERFRITVTDCEGFPVKNAVVGLGFSSGNIVFSPGTSYKYEARTDEQGKAEIRFNGKSSQFGWDVTADGYYRSGPHDESLRVEVTQIPPMFYTVTILEHEKERKVTIWKRINPQPMYSYRLTNATDFRKKVPVTNGRYGFDLKLGDWLPPIGNGEVADFYYVRNIGEPISDDGSVAWIEIEPGCGAYFEKQTGCKEFPSTHGANTNAVFKSRLPFMLLSKDSNAGHIENNDIAKSEEYMVLRTRARQDADGNIIEANYSKILGPFRFDRFIKTPCVVFNHRVNDPNLESDCSRNMLKQFRSNAFPP